MKQSARDEGRKCYRQRHSGGVAVVPMPSIECPAWCSMQAYCVHECMYVYIVIVDEKIGRNGSNGTRYDGETVCEREGAERKARGNGKAHGAVQPSAKVYDKLVQERRRQLGKANDETIHSNPRKK